MNGYDYMKTLADNSTASTASIVVAIIMIIALWIVFTKAGRHGWAAIIPIYNVYTLVKTAGMHGAVTILLFIPIVNIIVLLFVSFGVAKNFGKSGLFGFFGLWLFAVIGYLILALGSAKYVGAKP
jgi:hypothetical protein